MVEEPAPPLGRPHRAPTDGWLGTPELPGYRAGNIVAKLDDLPLVDPDHLYFDLLLLDADGELQDSHSGPCRALARGRSIDERSRFVRVVAELVRHVAGDIRGLSMIGKAVGVLSQRGIDNERLVLAAQLFDEACSADVVIASLQHVLELSLGADEAPRVVGEVVARLAGTAPAPADRDAEREIARINAAGLSAQVAYVVARVGKAHARRLLRDAIDFALVPTPELFGV
jgi:hypothetical protein